MEIAVTGHRRRDCEPESVVRQKFREVFENVGPDVVINGLCNGVDLWAADEARLLGIEIWSARPWAGHGPVSGDEELYATIVEASSRVVDVDKSNDYPGPWAYYKRNEWMVDNSTHVLAYIRPDKTSGGTHACVRYARKVGRPVRNIYGEPV